MCSNSRVRVPTLAIQGDDVALEKEGAAVPAAWVPLRCAVQAERQHEGPWVSYSHAAILKKVQQGNWSPGLQDGEEG